MQSVLIFSCPKCKEEISSLSNTDVFRCECKCGAKYRISGGYISISYPQETPVELLGAYLETKTTEVKQIIN